MFVLSVSWRTTNALTSEWDSPEGVPISALLFGGRRATAVPLVTEARDWEHGVYLAANIASEGTAAAENELGKLRRDPFAMLPFCGYNIADYFSHWLRQGATAAVGGDRLPRIFLVNWFRKAADGRFLWPGFGDNARVLKWIIGRVEGVAEAEETPIGLIPARDSLDLGGLGLRHQDIEELLSVDAEAWRQEAAGNRSFLETFGSRLPAGLLRQQSALEERLRPSS